MTRAKRSLDLIVAAGGLILLAPLFLIVAASIRLEDGGPVFFRQVRVGRHGLRFRIWKFRTMVADAERHGTSLTLERDRRITRVGHFLRASRIDELPQLLNVVKGEMSLVGPRPELPQYVAGYGPAERSALDFTPGITDPASIEYRHEAAVLGAAEQPEEFYRRHILPAKIRISVEYAQKSTLFSDVAVMGRTLMNVAGQTLRLGSPPAEGLRGHSLPARQPERSTGASKGRTGSNP